MANVCLNDPVPSSEWLGIRRRTPQVPEAKLVKGVEREQAAASRKVHTDYLQEISTVAQVTACQPCNLDHERQAFFAPIAVLCKQLLCIWRPVHFLIIQSEKVFITRFPSILLLVAW